MCAWVAGLQVLCAQQAGEPRPLPTGERSTTSAPIPGPISAPTAAGPILIVLAKSRAEAVLVDPSSATEVARLPVGVGPHEAATAADGRTVVVCNYGAREPGSSLTVIDAHAKTVTRTIVLEFGETEATGAEEPEGSKRQRFLRPHGIAFLPDGDRVVVTAETQRRLLVVDIREGRVLAALPTEAHLSHMVVLDSSAGRAFVSNIGGGSISAVDLEARSVLRVVETGAGAEGLALRPASRELWVGNRAADTLSLVSTDSLEVLAELQCGSFPIRVAFTPDGRTALVSCAKAGTVEVFDATKRERTHSITMALPDPPEGAEAGAHGASTPPTDPVPVGILVTPDGATAFVANTQADALTILDLREHRVRGRMSLPGEPDGMCWVP
ncbi:MAG: cytochrome D1 domain-containing protein, partial [Planctomycetota bacterium]